MPELDVFTQGELQWGALKTSVLGMFYPHPDEEDTVEFSGDLNNYLSAHKYLIYSPDDRLLDLVSNSMVPAENRFLIGKLRLTECRLPLPNKPLPDVDIYLSTDDFKGTRTAMFGKTRLGKSNVVKLIVQSLIETTKESKNVGQLIFDINGEYANDNPQDDNLSVAGAYPDVSKVYALVPKNNTVSPLKLNFYEDPNASKNVLSSLLRDAGRTSGHIEAFNSVELPDIDEVRQLPPGSEQVRSIRKLQYYWAILRKARFSVDEQRLRGIAPTGRVATQFNPGFSQNLRTEVYGSQDISPVPSVPNNLDELLRDLEVINRFRRSNPNSSNLSSSSGNPVFDLDDTALLEFLEPPYGRSGVTLIQPFRIYHDHNAGNFVQEILQYLDDGKTVILDLGNANEEVMKYFSRELSTAVFRHQTTKFTSNTLGHHFIQLYFEEAHNLFGSSDNRDETEIYRKFAKEGAKYHIGMVYSTQSPTTINPDLLAQTENFFIAHLASEDDVNRLARLNVAYSSLKNDILQAKTVGYIRMLTRSHRFVVSIQAQRFSPQRREE
ncbi:ATP-binding protein [Candidatus Poribacteria bacterium]